MTLLIDAGPLVAQADRRDPLHAVAARLIRSTREALVTSPFVAQEVDHLVGSVYGVDAELAVLDDLAAGTYRVECLDQDELASARRVVASYRDLRIGLADASLVVLARRLGTRRIVTFDERHFRAITPLQGGSFMLLPADA